MAPRLIPEHLMDLFVMDRTPGKHVSSAIHRVMSRLHPDRFTNDPIDQVRANLGNAMEQALVDALAHRYPDRYFRPGEITYKSHHGTPDLLDMWGGNSEARHPVPYEDWAVVEIKLTWASAGRADDPEDVWWWRYWQQGRAYAKMLGLRKVIIIVVFINGAYEGGRPSKPSIVPWIDEFTEEELDETWQMVETYSR